MKSVLLILLLYGLVLLQWAISAPSGGLAAYLLPTLYILAIGTLTSLFLSAWYTGSFRQRFMKSLRLGFPLMLTVLNLGCACMLVQ